MSNSVLNIFIDNTMLELEIQEILGHKVLVVSGEIDIHTALQFRQGIVGIFDTEQHLIIDMHNVNYVDTSGLGILAYAIKHLSPSNGTVNLVGCNERLQDLLEITQMSAFIALHNNMEDAIDAVYPPGIN